MLNNMGSLRCLKGMRYWKGLTEKDREDFKRQVRCDNLDLDISDVNVPDLTVFTYKVSL